MQSILRSLHGKQVRIDQFSEVSVAGLLVNIQSDYVSIWSNGKEITHYPLAHIKAVTTDVTEGIQELTLPVFSFPSSFAELVESLVFSKVRIENGEGARVGILSEMSDENVTLVVETKHVTYYPISKIKNISPIFKVREESAKTGGDSDTTESSTDQQELKVETQASDDTNTKSSGTSHKANNEAKMDQRTKQHTSDSSDSKSSSDNKPKSTAKPIIFKHKLAMEMLGVLDSSEKKPSTSRKQSGSSVVHCEDNRTSLNMMIGKGSRSRSKHTKSC